jgi:hypothetical protein
MSRIMPAVFASVLLFAGGPAWSQSLLPAVPVVKAGWSGLAATAAGLALENDTESGGAVAAATTAGPLPPGPAAGTAGAQGTETGAGLAFSGGANPGGIILAIATSTVGSSVSTAATH